MRRAVVRTPLADADRVAAAVRPDNTPELATRVDDGAVVTTVERESTGGLRATLDDYLVNLGVARETGAGAAKHARQGAHEATDVPADTATGGDTCPDTDPTEDNDLPADADPTDDTDTPTDTP